MVTVGTRNQETRDEIGSEPTTHEIHRTRDETMIVEVGPTQSKTSTIGESWIVGSATNGIVGVNTGTQSGQQQVVGGSGRVDTITRVININNRYIDRLNFDTFRDTGSSDVITGTANQIIKIENVGSAYQTVPIFLDNKTVVSATLNMTVAGTSNITTELSPDNGQNFEVVELGTAYTFTNVGTALKVRLTGTATGVGTVSRIEVLYNQ